MTSILYDTYGYPQLIGLTGAKHVGKSEVVRELANPPHNYIQYEFALPIKRAVAVLLDCSLSRLSTGFKDLSNTTFSGLTPRDVLVIVGDGLRFQGHPDFWINLTLPEIKTALDDGFRVVVHGLRYTNEVDAIRDLGGVIWRVRRPTVEPKPRTVIDRLLRRVPPLPHSEREWNRLYFDTEIDNSGTLQKLQAQVHQALVGRR